MPKSKSFYIIDGHAHIYRAYFAPFRDLTVADHGEPTKATFVFTQMLLNLVEQRKPDYLAMVIDSGDETVFRKEFYPEYKANRTAAAGRFSSAGAADPADRPATRAPDLRQARVRGRRSDRHDGEASCASRISRSSWSPRTRTCGRSLNACTHMYDVQANEVIDAKKLEDKVGYGPHEAVEVQTLMGDASTTSRASPASAKRRPPS